MLMGVAASPGIGIGRAVLVKQEEIKVPKHTVNYVDAEKQRFLDAIEVFVAEIEQAYELANKNLGASEAAILGAQIAIISDPELAKEVLRSIERQHVNVEYAFNSICNGYIALFSNLEDELMRARAADFRDIKNRMLCILTGAQSTDLTNIPAGSILVAEDIPPSQAALIDTGKVLGIATSGGTKFSHIAIIARALRLPAVVGVEGLLDEVNSGEILVVDAHTGTVLMSPTQRQMEEYREIQQVDRNAWELIESYRDQLTRTVDGRRITLASNLALPQELQAIRDNNADGIGLFRTEFLYMERKKPPTESEQYETYKNVVHSLSGRPVVIRTLDIGGDKDISYLHSDKEDNPFLGYRAVRFCLDHKDIFKAQLAAILRAAVFGDVRIMIPMITSITELRRVKKLIARVETQLLAEGKPFRKNLPLGIMIETPAAVVCAPELAREADFFSIGTNDLTQYILAVDRANVNVAGLYDCLHPAVLRMVASAVEAAAKAKIPVCVCGEAAADPLFIPFLVGLGVNEVSVSSGALLPTRIQINKLSYAEWRARIPAILSLETAQEVAQFIALHAGVEEE